MKLIIIFGPPAVGKMTVGKELSRITKLKLFHNHMSIELVNKFFDFGTTNFERLDKVIRFEIFKEVAKSNLAGIIFTIVLDLDFEEDKKYIKELEEIFEKEGGEIKYVELKSSIEERLKRNKQADRLIEKPSKRDIEFSERSLLNFEKHYRMNTKEGEFNEKDHLKIDNTNLEAKEVAKQIKEYFDIG